ncbi:ATP-binding cassette domain-containing protein, partial [Mycobacterium tuberculosis]|nr:ATP-binding cassette domain-containing protein [Mycobacterium tuberculosis]
FMQPRAFGITMGMMTWGIDGRRFEMDGVAPAETVKAGTTEIWEFRNDESMMLMAHAMHVHGVQFRVRRGTVHALMGENGAGKSTLMKILAGIYVPDQGEVFLKGLPIRLKSPLDALDNGIAMI